MSAFATGRGGVGLGGGGCLVYNNVQVDVMCQVTSTEMTRPKIS